MLWQKTLVTAVVHLTETGLALKSFELLVLMVCGEAGGRAGNVTAGTNPNFTISFADTDLPFLDMVGLSTKVFKIWDGAEFKEPLILD